MGTRIRKVLGYALTDVVPADARINWHSPLLDLGISPSCGDFVRYLEATGPFEDPELEDVDMVRAGIGERTAYRLGSCVVHSFDYGLPNIMALVPPSYADTWIQDDNIFDYVEAHLGGDGPATYPTFHDIPGIDPFDGRWMDKATGLELNHNYVRGYRQALGLNDTEQQDIAARRISFAGRPRPEEPLFADAAAAAERLTRLVPGEIRELARMGSLFTAPGIWTSLRPVLYTYWT